MERWVPRRLNLSMARVELRKKAVFDAEEENAIAEEASARIATIVASNERMADVVLRWSDLLHKIITVLLWVSIGGSRCRVLYAFTVSGRDSWGQLIVVIITVLYMLVLEIIIESTIACIPKNLTGCHATQTKILWLDCDVTFKYLWLLVLHDMS